MEYKRHKTSGKTKVSGTGSGGTALFVILALALVAAIIVLSPIGSFLLEHVIDPVLSCSSDIESDQNIVSALRQQETSTAVPTTAPTLAKTKQVMIMIEETPLYILQMGAYTDPDTARQRADELFRLGAGGAVYQDGKAYRVFAAAYLNKESLMKVQSQVRSDGYEATPYITESNALKITLEGEDETLHIVQDAVEIINEIPTALSKMCLSFDKQELTLAEAVNQLEDLSKKCRESKEQLTQLSDRNIGLIADLIGKYQENISTFLRERDTMNTDLVSGELKSLQLQCIIDYILFFNQK